MDRPKEYDEMFPPRELERLFDKTLRLILQTGLEDIDTAAIASVSGVDAVQFQSVFPTKQHFLRAIVHWYYIKFAQQMGSIMAMHSDIYSAMESTLNEFAQLCFDRKRDALGLFRPTVVDLCYVDEALWAEFLHHHHIWEELLHEKLRKCQEELKNPQDVLLLTSYFRMTLAGLYELVKLGASEDTIYQTINLALEVVRSRLK